MIFGLALSVGALALVAKPPASPVDLLRAITTFGFSFLILITVWLAYTRIMSVLPLDDRRAVTLNTVLLFTVSLEPFLFNVLQTNGVTSSFGILVSQTYALDLGVMMAVLATFAWAVATEPNRPLSPPVRSAFRREAIVRFVTGGIFFVSIAPLFDPLVVGGQSARILLWGIPLVLLIANRRWQAGVQEE